MGDDLEVEMWGTGTGGFWRVLPRSGDGASPTSVGLVPLVAVDP